MTYELRIFANIRILIWLGVAALLFFGAYSVFAQEEPNVEFPVAELGSCASKQACKAYCDEVEHIAQCIDFAERHGLMHGEELEEAKKVKQALLLGAELPGGCRGKQECQVYCEEPMHINECLAFAEAAGFMSSEELEDARRVAPLMARGEMPGGCRSREQCETYCSEGSHTEECATFFEKAGFISSEEAEMFRKTGGKGPGDCRGKEECEDFCNNPANQKACFEFAKEHDLIPEEELQNMEEGIGRFREGFQNAPPEVAQCLKSTIGEDVLSKIEAGTFLPNRELGEHMRKCFEEHLPGIIEQRVREQGGESVPPEAAGCIQGILGDPRNLQGPPSAEQEQRIRQECFPQQSPEGFQGGIPRHEESGEGISPEFQQQYQQEFQQRQGEEFERQYQEEFQREFEQEYQRQYQEEFQRQLQQQAPEGFQPSEEFQQPESFTPPEGFQAPQEFHSVEPPPASSLPRESFLGAVWEAMKLGLTSVISH